MSELDPLFAEMERSGFVDDEGGSNDGEDNFCRWEGCFRRFQAVQDLSRHVEAVHAGGRPSDGWVCKWTNCKEKGAAQESREALLTHTREHTGDLPYDCPSLDCSKSTADEGRLLQHLRQAHSVADAATLEDALRELHAAEDSPGAIDPEAQFAASDPVDPTQVAAVYAERLAREETGYDEAVERAATEKVSRSMVAPIFDLAGVQFNPSLKADVYSDAEYSLKKYQEAHQKLSGATSVAAAGPVDQWDEKDLAQNLATMEQYYAKLERLQELLDSELKQATEEQRLATLKKDRLVDALIQKETTTTSSPSV